MSADEHLASGSLRDVFLGALECSSPTERAAYLQKACGGNVTLRHRVEVLLKCHCDDNFLESPLREVAEALAVAPAMAERPGTVVGRYKLLEKLGEGGCGVVYLAEQEEPMRRRVALKIIKVGLDTREFIARFEAERQALAMMDHPNIARVFDAGATESGRPFFVMELVSGSKLTDFCDAHRLSLAARLDLFAQVCHGVQHAHQKGVIHRDLKPSNVLVTLHEGVPSPKVIDFGIAKATSQQRLTDKTLFTAFDQFVGTPAYMSPEQAEMGGLNIDTRSDIYSLGVLLYELLTGTTPFDTQELLKASFDEMRRMIRETEPPRPSARRTQTLAPRGVASPLVNASKVESLISRIDPDLDWIVMKALEKDRARRYATASDLVADLQRHRNSEPVLARSPSQWYRLQKLAARHRVAFTAAAAVSASLVIGLCVASWALVRERAARARAQHAEATAKIEADKSRQVSDFLQNMLRGVDPAVALGLDTTLLRQILDRTAADLDPQLREQPEVAATLRATLGDTYRRIGQYTHAEALLQHSLNQRLQRFGSNHLQVAESQDLLGSTLLYLRQPAKAEALFRDALALRRKLLGPEHPQVAEVLNNLALALKEQRRFAEADPLLQEALAMQRKLLGPNHPEVAKALHNLGSNLYAQTNLPGAESFIRQALERFIKVHGDFHPDVAVVRHDLASVIDRQRRHAEAETLFRQALQDKRKLFGSNHPQTVVTLRNLAGTFRTQGRLEEAEEAYRDSLAGTRLGGVFTPRDLHDCLYGLGSMIVERAEREASAASIPPGSALPASVIGPAREAEQLLREFLSGYAQSIRTSNDTATANARSDLAAALNLRAATEDSLRLASRDAMLAEAESLLLLAQPRVQISTSTPPERKRKTLLRLVRLYETMGQPAKAAAWKEKLDAVDHAQAPATIPLKPPRQ